MDKALRKEFLSNNLFMTILQETVKRYPEIDVFNPNRQESTEVQVEKWKEKSAERKGFALCFNMITGIYPEDIKND